MFEFIILAVLVVLIAVALAIPLVFTLELFGWLWTGVPYVPVRNEVIERVRAEMRIDAHSVVYDLGCGDGRVLFALAKDSDARFVGVEKAPFPYLAALVRKTISGRNNVRILYGDIYTAPISDATHIYLYLFGEAMRKLEPTLMARVKNHTEVFSCDFIFPNMEPVRSMSVGSGNSAHTLRVYSF